MIVSAAVLRYQIVLLLASASLLSFQIVLLQLLATSQWHYFAYFVISCALLGFGAAGTVISLVREKMIRHHTRLLPVFLSLSAITLSGSIFLSHFILGAFDSILLFVNPMEVVKLAILAIFLVLPFLFGALGIGLIFILKTEKIGLYYFANMLGSGFGCFLGLVGLLFFFPHQLIPICSSVLVAAAIISLKKAPVHVWLGVVISMGVVTASFFLPHELPLSQYKDLKRVLSLPNVSIIGHQPSPAGQIHVVSSPLLRSSYATSLHWNESIPVTPAVFVNGNMVGMVPVRDKRENPLRATTKALPYTFRSPQTVAVLSAGTGNDVIQALHNDASSVIAVEPHSALRQAIVKASPGNFGWLYAEPRATWEPMAPRTWLARDTNNYDLLVLPDIGGLGGHAGLFAMEEKPLLTSEALSLAWDKLTPDGLLSATTWIDYPVRAPGRLLASLLTTLERARVPEPENHIVAIRNWGTITFCLSKNALDTRDLEQIRAFSMRWGFDIVLLPGLLPGDSQRFNRLQDDSLMELVDAVMGPNREELYRNYPFHIQPVDDNRPYFLQFLKWDRVGKLAQVYNHASLPFLELGLLVTAVAALTLTGLAVTLIMPPILFSKVSAQYSWRTLVFFGCLGLGYMWVELILVHRYEFYLGHPVLATALVICGLLVSSACGSVMTEKFSKLHPWKFTFITSSLLCLYMFFLTPALQATMSLALSSRIIISLVILIPAGFFMGMPFPLGLKLLHRQSLSEVPWAWCINGCFSVIGAAFASLITVQSGYRFLLVIAATTYLVATIANPKLSNHGKPRIP